MSTIVGIDLQPSNTIDTRWPIRLDQLLGHCITDSETHIDERTAPMSKAPRVLSIGINAGMAHKSRERVDSDEREKRPAMRAVYYSTRGAFFITPAQIGTKRVIPS